MKYIRYTGTGTAPTLTSSLLNQAYDFSPCPVMQMPDADADLLLVRCGNNFVEVSETDLVTYTEKLTADVTVPVLATAQVDGYTLTLVYTEAGGTDGVGARLKYMSKPLPADFAVVCESEANVVTNVALAGKTVTLTLTDLVVFENVVTLGYTQVAGREIQDVKGNLAADLTAQAVTNVTAEIV